MEQTQSPQDLEPEVGGVVNVDYLTLAERHVKDARSLRAHALKFGEHGPRGGNPNASTDLKDRPLFTKFSCRAPDDTLRRSFFGLTYICDTCT